MLLRFIHLYQGYDSFEAYAKAHERQAPTKAEASLQNKIQALQSKLAAEQQLRTNLAGQVKQLRKYLQVRDDTIAKLHSHLQLYDPDTANPERVPASVAEIVVPQPRYLDNHAVDYPALLAVLDQLREDLIPMREGVAKTRQSASAQQQMVREAAAVLRQINADLLRREKQLAAREADISPLMARKQYVDQAVATAQERMSAATSVAAVVKASSSPPMSKTVLVVQIAALHRLKSIIRPKDFAPAADFAEAVAKKFGSR